MNKEVIKLALHYIEANAETKDEFEIAEGLRQVIAEAEKQERNFCSRCGKKLNKNDWDIHTCTPPLKQEQDEPVLVTVKEFVKLVEGKENILGRPVYWTQWPYENTKPQPQQRTWVGLTDQDMNDPKTHNLDFILGARWAEEILKDRNK